MLVFVLRMKKAEIPCPEVVLLKKHILVMSFIGKDHVPAPKLKDVILGSEDMKNAYYQVLHVRTRTGSPLSVSRVDPVCTTEDNGLFVPLFYRNK